MQCTPFSLGIVLIVQRMTTLSMEQRWAIISSWKQTHNIAATSRALGFSEKAVHLWVKRFHDTGDLLDKPRPGATPFVSREACATAMELLTSPEFGDAESVSKELFERGITSKKVHRTTVARQAKKYAKSIGAPIKPYRGRPAQDIKNDTKEKRVAFCLANKHRNWNHVMFTDRKKFLFKYPGVQVKTLQWGRRGCKPKACGVNHPMCVNLYAGITCHGVTKCHLVTGTSQHKSIFTTKSGKVSKNITTHEYRSVLQHTFLPCGDKLFCNSGISNWVLQQDNDPTHKPARNVVDYWGTRHPSSPSLLENWPPSSPDLNIIENCWAYVQRKVDAQGHKTFENFRSAVVHEIEHLPIPMLRELFKSMPKRVAKVLELNGERLGC